MQASDVPVNPDLMWYEYFLETLEYIRAVASVQVDGVPVCCDM